MAKESEAHRIRRSYLFVPLSSEKFIAKAEQNEKLDVVILDLEDGVSPDAKDSARAFLPDAARRVKEAGKDVFVRVNDPCTSLGIQDLLALDLCHVDAVMLPKASHESIIITGAVLDYLEFGQKLEAGTTELAVMVETGDGLLNSANNLSLSKRITTIIFGEEDYSTSLGIKKEESVGLIDYAKYRIVTTARALQLDVVDSPCTNFRDKDVFESAIQKAKMMGFTGKCTIHPIMIENINTCFSPSEDEIEKALQIWKAFEMGLKEHKGAISLNGQMIDKPIAEKARLLLKKTGRI